MDKVFILGLRISTVIGIHPWERDIRQDVVLDIDMASDIRRAADTDGIAQALDYEAVSNRLVEFIGASEFQLIETLAEQTAQLLAAEFGVRWLRLTVHKPGAVEQADSVGVVIERGSVDGSLDAKH